MMTPPRKRTSRTDAKRNRHVGRHAKPPVLGRDTPGLIMLLALVGALPVVVIFIVGVMLLAPTGVHPLEVWPTWRTLFYVVTPVASAAALWFHRRSPHWVRDHNAARAGRALAWANLASWGLFGGLYLVLF